MSRITERVDRAGQDASAPARRGVGMIATSQPRAVEAGAEVLRAGGHAVDAAVCAAAVLGVVEPMSTSIGGDCFALVWDAAQGQLHGLNASGRAPASASIDALETAGHGAVPEQGILAVTVPGALDGFEQLLSRFGTRPLGELLEPAVRAARDGFEVTPVVARQWAAAADRLARGHGTDGLLLDGRPPAAGVRFRQPALASTLAQIAREGADAFYRGAIGQRVAAEAQRLGGWLTFEDLQAHRSEWVEPLSVSYRGHPVYQLPPNTQGMVVLQALRVLEELPLADLPPDERAHVTIEALKLAFADASAHIADPAAVAVPVDALLDEGYLMARAETIGERAAQAPPTGLAAAPGPFRGGGDTVYVAAVDACGNACSLIHSIYMPFGAGVVAADTGFCLQNRGALFSLDRRHPNALASGKRPYHTIIPAMAFAAGRPWLVFGVVGGFQQPQAQVQLLTHLIDGGLELDDALAAPRLRWLGGASVAFESGWDPQLVESLRARGHAPAEKDGAGGFAGGFGGAQAIALDPWTGAPRGASDPRKDGSVLSTG